jgi:CRP/FNR family cyclic AMP-dependent transcriptional regulator
MVEQTLWYGGFLDCLSPRVREKLLSRAVSSRYTKGKTIFHEGDPSLHLYIVKSGKIAIEAHMPSAGAHTNVTIYTAGPGDLFSWSALVEPHVETAGARAVEESDVLGIEGSTLMELCGEDPALGFEMYRTLAQVISARLVATRLQLLDIFT